MVVRRRFAARATSCIGNALSVPTAEAAILPIEVSDTNVHRWPQLRRAGRTPMRIIPIRSQPALHGHSRGLRQFARLRARAFGHGPEGRMGIGRRNHLIIICICGIDARDNQRRHQLHRIYVIDKHLTGSATRQAKLPRWWFSPSPVAKGSGNANERKCQLSRGWFTASRAQVRSACNPSDRCSFAFCLALPRAAPAWDRRSNAALAGPLRGPAPAGKRQDIRMVAQSLMANSPQAAVILRVSGTAGHREAEGRVLVPRAKRRYDCLGGSQWPSV